MNGLNKIIHLGNCNILMKETIQNYILKTLKIVISFFLILSFFKLFIIEPSKVNGLSMEPTFMDSDIIWVNRFSNLISAPQRYDIVQVLQSDVDKILVKRVIGLPGETLLFKMNGIYIKHPDDTLEEIAEPYLPDESLNQDRPGVSPEVVIPQNSYYVLGDNRNASGDSRDFGPVQRSEIIGQVIHERPQVPDQKTILHSAASQD